MFIKYIYFFYFIFCFHFSRKQEMGLFIAPDENGTAKGILFWDDGVSYGNILF